MIVNPERILAGRVYNYAQAPYSGLPHYNALNVRPERVSTACIQCSSRTQSSRRTHRAELHEENIECQQTCHLQRHLSIRSMCLRENSDDVDHPLGGWVKDTEGLTSNNLNPGTTRKVKSNMLSFDIARKTIDPDTGLPLMEMNFDDMLGQSKEFIETVRRESK